MLLILLALLLRFLLLILLALLMMLLGFLLALLRLSLLLLGLRLLGSLFCDSFGFLLRSPAFLGLVRLLGFLLPGFFLRLLCGSGFCGFFSGCFSCRRCSLRL